ncbi:MAG: 4-(cytidine 5'-diphospho)-2-C-methyl-D-erythritol kinase [Rhodobacterales bacterium]|nr:MAG: 4-(cytidine 5'-diphospho)-2-C-methyl-D-erythritol kinase [Rhodobacterales bacterium]
MAEPLAPRDPGFAPAKVNLSLHVTGQRADGLHLLDSLVMFADVGDHLSLSLADEMGLTVQGPRAEGVPGDGRNLVLKVLRAMGVSAQVVLDKQLPAAAGIGGGSSDGAAALRLAQAATGRAFRGNLMALGADLPVCMLARAARMRGAGEQVEALSGCPVLPAVLINPGVEVPTGAVFAALERRDNLPMPDRIPGFDTVEECAAWLRNQRNDLEPPAMALVPEVAAVCERLRAHGALLARMSGSGATCFGLFPTAQKAREAATTLREHHPRWWAKPTLLS